MATLKINTVIFVLCRNSMRCEFGFGDTEAKKKCSRTNDTPHQPSFLRAKGGVCAGVTTSQDIRSKLPRSFQSRNSL